jgi:site-specific recombinase XerD
MVDKQLSVYLPDSNEEKFLESAHFVESTKSSENRMIPLNPIARYSYESALAESKGNYFVFCPGKTEKKLVILKRGKKCQAITARHISDRTIAYVMKRICKSSGVKYIGPHGLRHTFSANFLMNGGDIYTLSALLGHKSVDTTKKFYGYLSHTFLNSAVNMVNFK